MNIQQALKTLNIEDYSERIFNSNSHGELFHIHGYIFLAEIVSDMNKVGPFDFRSWFEDVVKYAESNWPRPDVVFQHIEKIFLNDFISVTLPYTNN